MPERRFPLTGDVDLATVADLQAKLDVLIVATEDDIVLDCETLAFIDSVGIDLVLHVHQTLRVQGRVCRIENMSDKARRPFDILGLTERLGIGELDPA